MYGRQHPGDHQQQHELQPQGRVADQRAQSLTSEKDKGQPGHQSRGLENEAWNSAVLDDVLHVDVSTVSQGRTKADSLIDGNQSIERPRHEDSGDDVDNTENGDQRGHRSSSFGYKRAASPQPDFR